MVEFTYNTKRLEVFKEFALSLSSLSKCTERKVSALICDSKLQQIYSIGINGGPSGVVDCMCELDGKYGCIHAEINALIKDKSLDNDKVMIVTLAPCNACAAAIINSPSKFKAVFYCEEWKDKAGIILLSNAGILVRCIGK